MIIYKVGYVYTGTKECENVRKIKMKKRQGCMYVWVSEFRNNIAHLLIPCDDFYEWLIQAASSATCDIDGI